MPVNTTLADEIEFRTGQATSPKRLLIYFIPGNPGLVEYYRRYLSQLQKLLQERPEEIIIHGSSHDGFEFHPPTKRINAGPPPFTLQQEIHCVRDKLSLKARVLSNNGTHPLDVILIGHSVGAYILLETISWWQNQHQHPTPSRSQSQSFHTILSGISLFPTIVDIAQSSKGQTLSPALNHPYLTSTLLIFFATILDFLRLLNIFTQYITPGTEDRSSSSGGGAAAVTAAFARSDHGIRQLIYMARDELETIKGDKWHAQHLWGGAAENSNNMEAESDGDEGETSTIVSTSPDTDSSQTRTKLYFLFGKDDYWVNNESREELIRSRGNERKQTTTTMEVLHQRPEIPHTFSLCAEHSDYVAEKSVKWIIKTLDGWGGRSDSEKKGREGKEKGGGE
ncbi:hypothetical protein BST61_g6389 [Cercospora zeina]